jgi:hypothetical protein
MSEMIQGARSFTASLSLRVVSSYEREHPPLQMAAQRGRPCAARSPRAGLALLDAGCGGEASPPRRPHRSRFSDGAPSVLIVSSPVPTLRRLIG